MNPKLPERCYAVHTTDNSCIIIENGVNGYFQVDPMDDMYGASEEKVDAKNAEMGITKAQKQAMLKGSKFGWDTPASNPDNYDEDGLPITASKK